MSRPILSVGVDVQVRRPCAAVILDADLRMVDSGWLARESPEAACADLEMRIQRAVARRDGSGCAVAPKVMIGIDAPRRPLERKRAFYWERKAATWRKRRPSEKGWGRHCEVVVRASGLANPQWTPLLDLAPEWMRFGFGLFRKLTEKGYQTFEAFPSASYSLLSGERHAPLALDSPPFARGRRMCSTPASPRSPSTNTGPAAVLKWATMG